MNDYCSCLSPKSIRLTIRLGRPVSGEGGRFEVPAPLSLPWRAPRSMTIVTKNLPLLFFFFFFFVFCVWREKTTARTRRPCAMRELDDDLALLERVHVRITVSNAWGSRERHNTFAPLFPEKPGRVCVCVGGGGGLFSTTDRRRGGHLCVVFHSPTSTSPNSSVCQREIRTTGFFFTTRAELVLLLLLVLIHTKMRGAVRWWFPGTSRTMTWRPLRGAVLGALRSTVTVRDDDDELISYPPRVVQDDRKN